MSDDESYPPILTKENFWNELQEKHPKDMKVFCDWIDEYKKRVEWDKVFHVPQYDIWMGTPDGLKQVTGKQFARAPKFHEIPVAMQIGIFFQFVCEHPASLNPFIEDGMRGMIDNIRYWFSQNDGFKPSH